MTYERGDVYCTRHAQLLAVLAECRLGQPAAESMAVGEVSARTTAARAPKSSCGDAEEACTLWASYGQCARNEPFMSERCARSCGACERRTEPPRGGMPSTAASVSGATASAASAAADATSQPSLSLPLCESTCSPSDGAAPRCSGRGSCVTWNGMEWCECDASATERYVGLRCERRLAAGAECQGSCSGRGRCVHGHCECEFGWHGHDCSSHGAPSPLLTRAKLLAAGVGWADEVEGGGEVGGEADTGGEVGGEAGAGGSPPDAPPCVEPSYHQALARPPAELARLVATLPDVSPPLGCDSCAVVSSAGILRRREYGEHIDANECVFRINRAPTAGYERHVGSRTTYDFVNSFPHVRGLSILPRTHTKLIHGMVAEPWAVRDAPQQRYSGFDEYLVWADGHAEVVARNPGLDAHLLDLEWLRSSWEAYYAYLVPLESPRASRARPSSGWHVTRLALGVCRKVRLYGFSLEDSDFHYFDSSVQATVTPPMRDLRHGYTHKFAFEHAVFANLSATMPDRLELLQ